MYLGTPRCPTVYSELLHQALAAEHTTHQSGHKCAGGCAVTTAAGQAGTNNDVVTLYLCVQSSLTDGAEVLLTDEPT